MNKEQYIRSKFRNIISETIDSKIKDITEKLNLDKETKLYKDNEFDYVQEGNLCESCGGDLIEGECKECGSKMGQVMEDDKKLSKISDEEIEKLLKDLRPTSKHSKKTKKHDSEIDENFLKRIFGKKEKEEDPSDVKASFKSMPKAKPQEDYAYDPTDWDHNTGMPRSLMMDIDDAWRKRDEELKNRKPENNQPREKSEKEKEYEKEFERLNREYGAEATVLGIDPREVEDMHAKQSKGKESNETNEEQLYEVEFDKEIGEEETIEGNAFTGALAKAKKEGDDDFEVDGKKFKVKESILYTESDLVDLIERLVKEEKSKFRMKEPKGYREYEKAHRADKKENDDYLKSVAKKMTDYLKGASDEGTKYEMKETNKFPSENGGIKKGIRKKYTPSDAVDDYNDAFSYPGQTNLRFDEIKPNKKNIKKYLEGDSTTGNAQVDKDGNALGNVVPSNVGAKFYKNFEENLYGQEQADASYKRQPQPVDMAGDDTEEGSLKSKRGKKTAQGVLDKLDESVNNKETKMLNEEFEKIQKLMNYNKRTQ
jgi:hypothetical protein